MCLYSYGKEIMLLVSTFQLCCENVACFFFFYCTLIFFSVPNNNIKKLLASFALPTVYLYNKYISGCCAKKTQVTKKALNHEHPACISLHSRSLYSQNTHSTCSRSERVNVAPNHLSLHSLSSCLSFMSILPSSGKLRLYV